MKLQAVILFPLLALAEASPVADPVPEGSANPAAVLDKRDKWCRVLENTPCNSGAGTAYRRVRTITPSERFGVNCIDSGSPGTWDWVPGWGCWVSARHTKSAAPGDTCENGVPRC